MKSREKIKTIKNRKPKALSYFRTEYGRYGYKNIVRYLKVMDNGIIKVVDVTQLRTSSIRSFGSTPMKLFKSTKRAWENAMRKVINS